MKKKISLAFAAILLLNFVFGTAAFADDIESEVTAPAYVAESGGIQYETVQEAVDASFGLTDIKLIDSSDEDVYLDATHKVNLDLGGFTLNSVTSSGYLCISGSGNGSVGSINVNGGEVEIKSESISSLFVSSGKLHKISGGKIGILTVSEASLDISGGEVEALTVNKNATVSVNGSNAKIGHANVNYGEFKLISGSILANEEDESAIINYSGIVTVSGGTISSEKGCAIYNKGNGFIDINASSKVSISGRCAVFNDEHASLQLISSDSKNIVVTGTLEEGIRSDSSEYVIISNATISGGTYGISADTGTLAVDGGIISGQSAALQAHDCRLIIKNGEYNALTGGNSAAVLMSQCTANISGGKFNAGGKSEYSIFADDQSQVFVSSGEFKGSIPSGMKDKIIISGGTFDKDEGENTSRISAIKACLEKDFEVLENNGKYNVSKKADAGVACIIDASGKKTNYDDIYSAVTSLEDDDTLVLIDDLTDLNRSLVINAKAAINLNGKKLITTAPSAFIINNDVEIIDNFATSIVSGSEKAITVNKSLSIDGANISSPVGIYVSEGAQADVYNTYKLSRISGENAAIEVCGGTLKVYDGDISSSNPLSSGIKSTNGNVTVSGGKVSSLNDLGYGITAAEGSSLTVDGGVICGKYDAVYIDASNCDINGGVIYGQRNAIEQKGGSLDINGGIVLGGNYAVEIKSDSAVINDGVVMSQSGIAVKSTGGESLLINDGYIYGNYSAVSCAEGTTKICGGRLLSPGAALHLTGGDGEILGGSFERTAFSSTPSVIYTSGDAKLKISSCEINKGYGCEYPLFASDLSSIEIEGGNFYGLLPENSSKSYSMPYVMSGTLTITGGTFDINESNMERLINYVNADEYTASEENERYSISKYDSEAEKEEEMPSAEEPVAEGKDTSEEIAEFEDQTEPAESPAAQSPEIETPALKEPASDDAEAKTPLFESPAPKAPAAAPAAPKPDEKEKTADFEVFYDQVDLRNLDDIQVAALEALLADDNTQLLTIIDTFIYDEVTYPVDMTLTETEITEDDAQYLNIWYFEEDGNLKPVKFKANDLFEIVLLNTEPGRFVFTYSKP